MCVGAVVRHRAALSGVRVAPLLGQSRKPGTRRRSCPCLALVDQARRDANNARTNDQHNGKHYPADEQNYREHLDTPAQLRGLYEAEHNVGECQAV